MNENAGKIIIDIYPITPLSLQGQQFYSYLWDTEISRGSLVSISFFKRNIEGIVIGSRTDFERLGNFYPVKYRTAVIRQSELFNRVKLKKVNKILEENFLTGPQLRLAEFISEYYLSPIGTVLKFFCPKRTKERNKSAQGGSASGGNRKKIKLTKEQQSAVNKITTSYKLTPRAYLLFGPASSGKTEVYIHAIAKLKTQDTKQQFLILLPELTLTPQAIERYGQYFKPEETVVLHSQISKGQFYSSWKKIKSGEAKIIIGTRMAIFAPFKNLGLIVLDEEQDMSFKQWDMNPRYDARKVAEKLAEMNNCPLVFGSATPRVEDYYLAMKGIYNLLKLPKLVVTGLLQSNPVTTKIELVDMRKERWQKNYSPISKKLQSEIAYILKNNLQAILFINRQGMSNFSVCEKCKTVLKCPDCDRALVYDAEGFYRCLHCPYKTSIFPACSKCRGTQFRNVGLGTQKVKTELEKIFPGAKMRIVDSQTSKISKEYEKIYRDFSEERFDILIGTQMITKGWDLPGVALVAIIDADNLFSFPDYATDERAFQNIVQLFGRCTRLNSRYPGVFVIQTFNPENPIIKLAASLNYPEFYQREIEERKTMNLPPFSRYLKLVVRERTREKVENISAELYNKLKSKWEKSDGISTYPPADPLVPKRRGIFLKNLIIRFSGEIASNLISREIKKEAKGVIIDIDPISLT